jgi:hypothetical protein
VSVLSDDQKKAIGQALGEIFEGARIREHEKAIDIPSYRVQRGVEICLTCSYSIQLPKGYACTKYGEEPSPLGWCPGWKK